MLPRSKTLTQTPKPLGKREVHGSKKEHLRINNMVQPKSINVIIRTPKSHVQLLQHPLPLPLHLPINNNSHFSNLFSLSWLPTTPISYPITQSSYFDYEICQKMAQFQLKFDGFRRSTRSDNFFSRFSSIPNAINRFSFETEFTTK